MDRAFYDDYFVLEEQHWWFIGRRKIIASVLDRDVGAHGEGGRRILDVGCGTGKMLDLLATYGEVVGIDADQVAVDYCRSRGHENTQQVTGVPLPFEDGSFDLVTAFDVLEHIRDDSQMAGEIERVLKPGGHFVSTVPAFPSLWGAQDEISHHERRYTRRTFAALVDGAGFRRVRMSFFNSALFPGVAAVRLFRRVRPAPGPLKSDFEMTKPGAVNNLLTRVLGAEAPLISRTSLPFGVSLLVVAIKQGG